MDGIFQRHISPMLLVDPTTGCILDANPAALRFYGYNEADMRRMLISQINMLDEQQIQAEMQQAASDQRNYFWFQHRLASGEVRDVEVHSSPVERNNQTLLFSIVYDISESRRIEAIRDSLLKAIPLPLYYKDLEGRYLGCNEAFATSTGHSTEEIIGKKVQDLYAPELAATYEASDRELLSRDEGIQELEGQFVNAQGELRDAVFHKALIQDRHGRTMGLLGVVFDITERKRNEELAHQLAFYDSLTRLPNRRMISQRLGRALAESAENGLYGALMFLDLDNFKPANDLYGHDAGDMLLVEVARRLTDSVRANDMVGRLGGDEFVLILEALGHDTEHALYQAQRLAEKVRRRIGERYSLNGAEHECTASIGLALFYGQEYSSQQLLMVVDRAMYEAKAAGRNQIHCVTSLDSYLDKTP
ncbi:MAG: diguanylate cyclase [Gammaproteobacteria bacterium]|nr:diguanylate cyclase [Gammaproteobacteria bacterium]